LINPASIDAQELFLIFMQCCCVLGFGNMHPDLTSTCQCLVMTAILITSESNNRNRYNLKISKALLKKAKRTRAPGYS